MYSNLHDFLRISAPLWELGGPLINSQSFNSATVRENVAVEVIFGTLRDKVGVDESMEIVDEIIKRMGLEEHKNKQAGALMPVKRKPWN